MSTPPAQARADGGQELVDFAKLLLGLVQEDTGLALDTYSLIQRALCLPGLGLSSGDKRPSAAQPGSLHFTHTCRYTACTAANCTLCRHNPHKACAVQLRPKYVVGQEVAAPCGANLHVALAPSGGGKPLPPGSAAATQQWEALRSCGARAQLLLVDERARQQRTKELLMSGASGASNAQVAALLRQSTVHFDPAGSAMLSCSDAGPSADGSLLLPLADDGGCSVEGLTVACSTERATAGRKRAPVRLAALLVDQQGQPLDAAPALSPEFYVVSDRAENHEGMGTPLYMDSPSGHVRTIGKETQRRLADLPAACEMVGTRLRLPEGLTSVSTVRQLALLLQATMPSQATALSQVLKISKAQLEAASVHVATAVEPDSWLRAYVAPTGAALLFNCQQGGCDCAAPAAVMRCAQGPDGVLALSGLQRLGPNEAPLLLRRDGPLCTLYLQAEAAWAAPRHEGWVVLNVAGARYQTVEELEAALADEVRGQPVLEQLQSEPAAPAAPAALDQAAAQQVAAGTEQAGPQGAAPAPASPGEEAPKVVRTFALTLAGNPVSLAAAPSGGNSLSTATATEAQKRPHSSMSADGGQQQQQQQQAERAAKRRTSPLPWQQQRQQQQQQQQSSEHGPEGLSMHAEHRSLDSPTSQQGNASQGGHMAALPLQQPPVPLPQSLQRQPAALQLPSRPPALQLQAQHLPQQQQLQQSQHQLHQEQHHQLLQHLMSSAPTAPFQPLSQQEQQQAELLQLLCRLTQAPAPAPAPAPPAPAFHLPPSGRSAFHHPPHAPSQGFDAAASLRLLQGMTGAAAGAGAAPSAEFAVQSLPTQPWAPSLEQLAQIFARQ